jgi:hypothetical protein
MGHMALAAEDSVPAAKGHIERDAEGETERRVLCRNSEKSVPYCIADVKSCGGLLQSCADNLGVPEIRQAESRRFP